MSLAQKFERLPAAKIEGLAPAAGHGTAAVGEKSAVPIDFRNIVRRIAPQPVTKDLTPDAATVAPTPDVALGLLADVAKALPTLMNRCRSLEDTLVAAKDQARADLEAATEVSREWQQIAHALKVQVEQLEKELAAVKAQAAAAEKDKLSVMAEATRSQQVAAEAECLASLFKDKVIASFGVGSESHSILQAIRGRTQDMLTA